MTQHQEVPTGLVESLVNYLNLYDGCKFSRRPLVTKRFACWDARRAFANHYDSRLRNGGVNDLNAFNEELFYQVLATHEDPDRIIVALYASVSVNLEPQVLDAVHRFRQLKS